MNEDLAPPGALAPGGLRVTALGGISEIGRNMTVFEHLGRLLIIDCGVMFPTHDEPGVDLILPDFSPILHRLGPFPFWRGGEDLLDALEPLYPAAASIAAAALVGERRMQPEEPPSRAGRRGSRRIR